MPLEDAIAFVNDLMRAGGIKHLYIGGLAASAHGEPRATKDADLVILIAPDEIPRLLADIESRGLRIQNRTRAVGKLSAGLPVKIPWDRKYSFDLRLASYTIDGYALERAEDIEVATYGQTLRMATPEDLLVYKLARFDDIDRRDIRKVIEVQGTMDWPYVEARTRELSEEASRPEMVERLALVRTWASP